MTASDLFNYLLDLPKNLGHVRVVRLEHVHEQGCSSDYEFEVTKVYLEKSQESNETVLVIR